jgi:hypothetical protein
MFRATNAPAGRSLTPRRLCKPLRQLDDLSPVSGILIFLKARSNARPSSVDSSPGWFAVFAMMLHT